MNDTSYVSIMLSPVPKVIHGTQDFRDYSQVMMSSTFPPPWVAVCRKLSHLEEYKDCNHFFPI